MVLELHHLRLSQSDRILWMLEEMQLPYELKIYDRDPRTGLAPQSLKDITPVGTAPFLRDTSSTPAVELFESGAIIQYLVEVYGPTAGGAKLNRNASDPGYANSLQYFHFASGSIQGLIGRLFSMSVAQMTDSPMYTRLRGKLDSQLGLLDAQLGRTKYLADDSVSVADIMTVFSVTTMRGYFPIDLSSYVNLLRYLADVTGRPAYVEALRKGDHGMQPMCEANTRRFTQFEAFRPFLESQ